MDKKNNLYLTAIKCITHLETRNCAFYQQVARICVMPLLPGEVCKDSKENIKAVGGGFDRYQKENG